MLDTASCYDDKSPFSSPFQSPMISPVSSPNPTPIPSPSLRRLTRANSYRKGKKAAGHMDDFLRRHKKMQQDRSQSDTELATESDKEEVKIRRKKKSISYDFLRKSKSPATSPDSDSFDKYNDGGLTDRKHHGGLPDRKKSLSLIIDFKRFMELSPKPSRRSLKKAKSAVTSDEENDNEEGPLFQATTMFVPGYDFKTKTSTVDRSPTTSKGFLSRRGSKDKSLVSLLERVHSSPSLMRRGSKDKLERHTIPPSRSAGHIKTKSIYTQCDSTSVNITKTEDPLLVATRQLHSDMNNHSPSSSASASSPTEYLSVSERGAMIVRKHQNFQDLKKPKSNTLEVPHRVIPIGNVKKISTTFEDGSIFDKNIATERRKQFAKNELSQRFSGDHEKVFLHRSNSFEYTDGFYRKRSYTCDDKYTTGSESGYASPTESTISEASTQLGDYSNIRLNQPLINVQSIDDNQNELSNSWSYGQWNERNVNKCLLNDGRARARNIVNLRHARTSQSQTQLYSYQPIDYPVNNKSRDYIGYTETTIQIPITKRVISTDLCVTEL